MPTPDDPTRKRPEPPEAKPAKARVGEPFNPWRKICGFYPPDIVGGNKDLKLTDGQKRLYERGVRWCGQKGFFFMSVTIAETLGKVVRQVERDMATLEEKGLMAHVRRRRDSNLYRGPLHPIFDSPSTSHQEDNLDPPSTVLDPPSRVKKGVLDPPSTSHYLCTSNYVQGITYRSSASDDARGVRAPATTVRQNSASPDLFQEFIGIFLAAGKLLNDRDAERALKVWLNVDAPEHPAILELLKRSVVDGTWSDARHTPMPASYLGSKAWTRIGPGRVLPHPPRSETKFDNALRRAGERFRRGER